jgi:hypothetical protein
MLKLHPLKLIQIQAAQRDRKLYRIQHDLTPGNSVTDRDNPYGVLL